MLRRWRFPKLLNFVHGAARNRIKRVNLLLCQSIYRLLKNVFFGNLDVIKFNDCELLCSRKNEFSMQRKTMQEKHYQTRSSFNFIFIFNQVLTGGD